jgi:arylsulfatase B
MIANIDDNVGRLRKFLDDEGLTEDTIFIFATDNGTAAGGKVHNSGMRGQKGSEYDGGHRVPFFVHWPQGGLQGGRDVKPLAAHVDVFPTLLDLCDIQTTQPMHFDGQSIAALLRGNIDSWPDRVLVTDSQRVRDPIKWRKSAVMTSQWRLVNGKELYDMWSDPGQNDDVASRHPEVVRRLTAVYDSWWDELEPTFSNDADIYLGHPQDSPARLTSHDWITSGATPWNQSHIRDGANSQSILGHWNVKFVESGDYTFRLRRWPEETQAAIDAPLPAGAKVPGSRAYRMTPGKAIAVVKAIVQVGDQIKSVSVASGQQEAVIRLRVPAGKNKLTTTFETADGDVYGAFYAYVEKQ